MAEFISIRTAPGMDVDIKKINKIHFAEIVLLLYMDGIEDGCIEYDDVERLLIKIKGGNRVHMWSDPFTDKSVINFI